MNTQKKLTAITRLGNFTSAGDANLRITVYPSSEGDIAAKLECLNPLGERAFMDLTALNALNAVIKLVRHAIEETQKDGEFIGGYSELSLREISILTVWAHEVGILTDEDF